MKSSALNGAGSAILVVGLLLGPMVAFLLFLIEPFPELYAFLSDLSNFIIFIFVLYSILVIGSSVMIDTYNEIIDEDEDEYDLGFGKRRK